MLLQHKEHEVFKNIVTRDHPVKTLYILHIIRCYIAFKQDASINLILRSEEALMACYFLLVA